MYSGSAVMPVALHTALVKVCLETAISNRHDDIFGYLPKGTGV